MTPARFFANPGVRLLSHCIRLNPPQCMRVQDQAAAAATRTPGALLDSRHCAGTRGDEQTAPHVLSRSGSPLFPTQSWHLERAV
jgi:hypothetical protein